MKTKDMTDTKIEVDITDKVTSFETAKLAKEKGFSHHMVMDYYDENKELRDVGQLWIKDETEADVLMAPTQCMLQRWLREIKIINIEINCRVDCINVDYEWKYKFNGSPYPLAGKESHFEFKTYEDALEEGLFRALNQLK